jgi:hypothetical protein
MRANKTETDRFKLKLSHAPPTGGHDIKMLFCSDGNQQPFLTDHMNGAPCLDDDRFSPIF